MLQFLVGTNFPFMKYRRIAYVFSSMLVIATVVWLVTKGPRYSVSVRRSTRPASGASSCSR